MSAALTISLDETLLARVDALATEGDMSREAVVAMALANLLPDDGLALPPLLDWQAEKIRRGMADADRGAFVPQDEVDRIVRSFD